MHVRRTDYIDMPVAWALTMSYFTDALQAIPHRDRYELIVVSDDPENVRNELGQEPGVCDLHTTLRLSTCSCS
jgi:hypothetical protein